MLLFKKRFLEQIKRGEKTQTIRLWNCRRMKSGQRSYVPGIGYIAIVSVEPVELTGLTDDDAQRDGFPTAELLRNEICALYNEEVREYLTPFRVCFSVYPPSEQQKITRERQRQKQQQSLHQNSSQNQRQRLQKNRDAQQRAYISQTLDKLRKMSDM